MSFCVNLPLAQSLIVSLAINLPPSCDKHIDSLHLRCLLKLDKAIVILK